MAAGGIRFDGSVADFIATAAGRVWLAAEQAPGTIHSWRTGTGRVRSIGGTPVADAAETEPTVGDAYLLMLGAQALDSEGAAA